VDVVPKGFMEFLEYCLDAKDQILQGKVSMYVGKAICVGPDESDIVFSRRGILKRNILLYGEPEVIIVP
jgi:hypothetical protein